MRGATLFQITRWSFYIKTERICHSCDVLSMSDHKRTTSYTGRRCKETLKPDLSLTNDSYHPQQSNPKEHASIASALPTFEV